MSLVTSEQANFILWKQRRERLALSGGAEEGFSQETLALGLFSRFRKQQLVFLQKCSKPSLPGRKAGVGRADDDTPRKQRWTQGGGE